MEEIHADLSLSPEAKRTNSNGRKHPQIFEQKP